jgi:calcium permeable stress-gated cation channel
VAVAGIRSHTPFRYSVAFVGIVSNIAALCATYKWLAWLCTIPSAVRGIIQGILPPVLLAVLFMLLPIVLRLLARFEGIPTRVGIELSLMDRFFLFQVIVSLRLSCLLYSGNF